VNRAGAVVLSSAAVAIAICGCVPALPGSQLSGNGGGGASPAGAGTAGRGGAGMAQGGSGGGPKMGADAAVGPDASGGAGTAGGPDAGVPQPQLPCPGLATFDTPDLEGFSFNPYGAAGNLANPDAGPRARLSWNELEGSPSPGSLMLGVPFTDYGQYVDLQHPFGIAPPQNWTSYKLHVRVKVASGGAPSPQSPAGVQPYVATGVAGAFCGTQIGVPGGNGWNDYVLDLASCVGIEPSAVISYGVRVWSGSGADGDGGVSAMRPTLALIYVDSFWLEGSCPSTDAGAAGGGGPLACASRPAAVEVVANFDNATGGDPIPFGITPGISGQTFARQQDGSPPIVGIAYGPNGTNALRAAGVPDQSVIGWGFTLGLRFDTPVDASAYDAVRFTISAFPSYCQLSFAVLTPETTRPDLDPRGTCASGLACNVWNILSQPGTYCVPLGGGSPLLGLLWQDFNFDRADCAYYLDDVGFVQQSR